MPLGPPVWRGGDRGLILPRSSLKAKKVGSSWSATQTQLVAFYGGGKRTWVWRMVTAAQTLSDPGPCRIRDPHYSDHALRRGWVTDKVADLMFRSTTVSVSTILGSWISSTNCLEIQVKVAFTKVRVTMDCSSKRCSLVRRSQ